MSEKIRVEELLKKVRSQRPLVHNVTNYVVMNWTANCLLSVGASPIMAHAAEEMEAMTDLAHALVINIGTLSEPWVRSMEIAMKRVREKCKPIVFDPVGSGASTYRTETARRLLSDFSPTVIRGNASEIISLSNGQDRGKGVDSIDSSKSALDAAKSISAQFDCVVCVSGETDYIVEKSQVAAVKNGHPLMTRVTGMGCASTALIGAFLAVYDSPFEATVAAMAITGIAGEIAANRSTGPGSFQIHYLDALYEMSAEVIHDHQKITYDA